MHELSIAKNIIEIVKESVEEKDLSAVDKVVLKIGDLSGVVPASLLFSLEAITNNTELENAGYEVINVPFIVKCNTCGKESNNEAGIVRCTLCGSNDTGIISGNELLVSEIILKN
ncbi:MAG: hydrogenase maturation nickel metallochaperone HypA [Ignavibacteria bacterium]|nr:hydrogenase maturation nickel metallochaperone HypA [Ignavibacteria bacterium]